MILLYILWNTEAAILVKILLDATFSGIPLTVVFCVNEYIVKIYAKIIGNIFFWSVVMGGSAAHYYSGRFDIHLQVIQPIVKFP